MPCTRSLSNILLSLVAAAVLSLCPAAGLAETVVTSVSGSVESGDGPVAIHSVIAEDQTFETAKDGHCSLMVADEAMVQLCNAATVSISRRGRTRVMELMQGELKATVGPRSADQPLEIHTPAAIAALLGTVVHVSVDPVTGETTITSVEDRIRVQGVEEGKLGPIVLEPGQRVTIRPGEAPGQVMRAPEVASGDVSDCMFSDSELRLMAVAGARQARRSAAVSEIVSADIPDLSTPAVSAALIRDEPDPGVDDKVTTKVTLPPLPNPCDAVQCGPMVDPPPVGPEDPKKCSGRAGDHCRF